MKYVTHGKYTNYYQRPNENRNDNNSKIEQGKYQDYYKTRKQHALSYTWNCLV